MNGRNFLDLALLVPGVSPTNVGSTQLFAETSAVPGQGISVGSQRNFSNNFIVDGLSANDDAAGLSGIPYGVDAVDQFQVVTSGGQAELGRALGGYVNVVTKSGTNVDARRSLRLLPRRPLQRAECALRHDAADEPDAVRREPRRPDRARPDASSSRTSSSASWISPASSSWIRPSSTPSTPGWPPSAIPARRSRPASIPTRCTAPTSWRRSITSSAARTSSASATACTTSTPATPAAPAASNAPSASAGLDNIDQTVAFSNTMTLSARTVNETRAQFAYGDLKALADRSDRPGRQHRRRRLVRDALGQSAPAA